MRARSIICLAALSSLVAGMACSKSLDTLAKPDETAVKQDTTQSPSGYKGPARDTTLNGAADSARTRADQGQPVTSKGDTLNPGVDSTAPAQSSDTTGAAGMDTTTAPAQSSDSTGAAGMDTTQAPGADSTSQ